MQLAELQARLATDGVSVEQDWILHGLYEALESTQSHDEAASLLQGFLGVSASLATSIATDVLHDDGKATFNDRNGNFLDATSNSPSSHDAGGSSERCVQRSAHEKDATQNVENPKSERAQSYSYQRLGTNLVFKDKRPALDVRPDHFSDLCAGKFL